MQKTNFSDLGRESMKRGILILTLIILAFFSMSCVCASDGSDDVNETQLLMENSNDIVIGEDNGDISVADEGTYDGLYAEIGNGGDIELDKKTYTYNRNRDVHKSMEIYVEGTIDGKNAIIDMNGSDFRVFKVNNSGVTFKNIVFKNVNYFASDYGAVIMATVPVTIENCTFINNKVYDYDEGGGGAVYIRDGSIIKYCNFIGNRAHSEGGAIYCAGDSTIQYCNFEDNYASWGGAIHASRSMTIDNCNFTANTASSGAAFYSNEGIIIKNSNFKGNVAYNNGVIYSESANLSNCKFEGNSASYGSAVYLFSNNGYLDVDNCHFIHNRANCGAIYTKEKCNIKNSDFINNTAEGGAAIYFDIGDYLFYTTIVDNCNFYGNNASIGSTIYNSYYGGITILNSVFLNNKADSKLLHLERMKEIIEITFSGKNNYLNAIYSDSGITFDNVTYWGANGQMNTNSGGVSRSDKEAGQNITISINSARITKEIILKTGIRGNLTLNLSELCVFPDNYAISIYHADDSYYSESDVKDITFTKGIPSTLNLTVSDFTVIANVTNGTTGNVTFILSNENGIVKTETVNLTDSIANLRLTHLHYGFYNITAMYNGDDVYWPSMNNITYYLPKNGDFDLLQELIDDESSSIINLERNYTYNDFDTIVDGVLINRSVTINGNGFTIDAKGKSRIFKVTAGSINITNITFKNGNADYGGAIYFNGDIASNMNATFINNTADNHGGAIYVQGSLVDSTFGSTFIANAAKANVANSDGGAAIYVLEDVRDSTFYGSFMENTANGGTIYIRGDVGTSTFDGSFKNNVMEGNGAAFYIHGNVADSTFDGDYINNTAGYGGSAIFIDGAISGSTFNGSYINNTALYGNSAVNIGGSIVDSTIDGYYMNNKAGLNGGAIYLSGLVSNVTISATFINNTASNDGGAIFIAYIMEDSLINGSFINNTVMGNTGNGAVIYAIMVRNSTISGSFINNCANFGGGAIFINRKLADSIIYGSFINNTSLNGGAICIDEANGSNITGNFINNSAINYGGAIYVNNISNCRVGGDFENNRAISSGAIFCFYDIAGTVIEGNFKNNDATHYAGVIGADNVINSSILGNFENNKARNGGAIYVNGNVEGTIINGNFTNNNATEDGGAILAGGLINSSIRGNFENNVAETVGAVFINGVANGTIIDGTFKNNLAEVAGAIGIAYTINSTISGNFENNRADVGGAIFFAILYNSTVGGYFANNVADDGGAIYIFEIVRGSDIKGSFSNNTASKNGSAIYIRNSTINSNISGIYINNTGNSVICIGHNSNDNVIHDAAFINNDKNIVYVTSGDNIQSVRSWFGNNATNYNIAPEAGNVTMDSWLFLNATANPDALLVSDTSDIIFKLYLYNSTSCDVCEYDNAPFEDFNFSITSTGGNVDKDIAKFGEIIKYTATKGGIGSITATMAYTSYTIKLDIKYDPNLSVGDQEAHYGDNIILALDYNETATGKVNITLKGKNGNSYYFQDKDLNTLISLGKIETGEYEVTVSYSGDSSFINTTATGNLSVRPFVDLSVDIISNKYVYFLGEIGVWTITVHNAANGTNATNVVLGELFSTCFTYISSATENGTYDNKEGLWEIGFMGNGTDATLKIFAYANVVYTHILNEVVVVCDDDDWNLTNNWGYNYADIIDLPIINKTVSNVNPNNNEEILFNLTITNNAAVNYTNMLGVVDTLPAGLEFIRTENITGADLLLPELVNGQEITWYLTNITTDVPAVITVRVKVTGFGSLTNNLSVHSIFGHNKTVGCTVEVPKIKTQIIAKAVATTYNVNKNLVITLKDSDGNSISGVGVVVNLNGAKTYTTDKNGQIKINVAKLVPKTYAAKITFAGNDKYVGSSATVKVNVKKAKTKIVAKKKTFKKAKKIKKYTITLKDNKNNPIKKVRVTLKIKGKTYKAKTNKKGKATFKIKKLNKKGTFKATIKFKGNKYYKKVTKKVKIRIK